ncbi:YlbF family regulator [Cohnella endophytica]|uniref:YlbF family regulator n=1 Tax=Cohnella endophytica TaxID=2419778 RepID=A0A494Y025_9BACL|nr:YlbF family regulator [Cohnella endophytica]RKP55358.1 YlbF family regulator [Cohnella endophytica]
MASMTQTLPAAGQGVMENEPADMALLLSRAFELGDSLKNSAFAAEYVYWKDQVHQDAEVQVLTKQFAKAKEKFAECERFGRFHPDYNAALDEVYAIESRLDQVECVRQYKAAESSLDYLLNDISRTLAHAVSQSIKVPDNDPNPKASGCGNGGSCSCGSGGCG